MNMLQCFSLCCVLVRNIQFFLTVHSGDIMRKVYCGLNGLNIRNFCCPDFSRSESDDFLIQKEAEKIHLIPVAKRSLPIHHIEFNLTELWPSKQRYSPLSSQLRLTSGSESTVYSVVVSVDPFFIKCHNERKQAATMSFQFAYCGILWGTRRRVRSPAGGSLRLYSDTAVLWAKC